MSSTFLQKLLNFIRWPFILFCCIKQGENGMPGLPGDRGERGADGFPGQKGIIGDVNQF